MFDVVIKFQCMSVSAVVCHFGFLQSGATAVHYAALGNAKEVLTYLVEKGASVNVRTNVSMNGKDRTGFRISVRWRRNR